MILPVAGPSFDIPPGYGLQRASLPLSPRLEDLYGLLLVWQPPSPKKLYVLSADPSDGIGKDRACIDITTVGTVHEPEEQVAQFVSPFVDAIDLAPIIDLMGRLYTGADGLPAVAAIEINNHGLATQSELSRHLGYDNLYQWQYEDAADPSKRVSTRIGWVTNARSRPMLLSRYVKKVRTFDPTGLPDYRVNSPFTLAEWRDFQIPPEGALWEAEADPTAEDAHDDCIMAGAIGLYVAQTIQFESQETIADQRHRLAEEQARARRERDRTGEAPDYRNMDYDLDEIPRGWHDPLEPEEDRT